MGRRRRKNGARPLVGVVVVVAIPCCGCGCAVAGAGGGRGRGPAAEGGEEAGDAWAPKRLLRFGSAEGGREENSLAKKSSPSSLRSPPPPPGAAADGLIGKEEASCGMGGCISAGDEGRVVAATPVSEPKTAAEEEEGRGRDGLST